MPSNSTVGSGATSSSARICGPHRRAWPARRAARRATGAPPAPRYVGRPLNAVAGREAEQHAERARRDLRARPARRRRARAATRPSARATASGAASTCSERERHRQAEVVGQPAPSSPSPARAREVLARRAQRRELEHRAAAAPPSRDPSANSSSSAANVPGTGRPSMARWPSVRDVEKPSAPASIASCTMAAIAAISSGLAGSLAAPRSPIAYARTAPCDTCTPTSIAELARGRARRGTRGTSPSSSPCPRCSAVPGMSSTPSMRLISHFSSPGRTGANPTPQLPGDHGGDAVARRRLEQRVPRGLAVVVRVDVDEAGRDEQAGGVDGLGRVTVERPTCDTATITPSFTATSPTKRGGAGAVDDRAVGDLDVVHGCHFTLSRGRARPRRG